MTIENDSIDYTKANDWNDEKEERELIERYYGEQEQIPPQV